MVSCVTDERQQIAHLATGKTLYSKKRNEARDKNLHMNDSPRVRENEYITLVDRLLTNCKNAFHVRTNTKYDFQRTLWKL